MYCPPIEPVSNANWLGSATGSTRLGITNSNGQKNNNLKNKERKKERIVLLI